MSWAICFLYPTMAPECFWSLCSSLTLVLVFMVVQGKQTAHLYPAPEILKVYADGNDKQDFGAWKMNIEWRINSIRSNSQEKVSSDMEIFHTEQMRLVHNETIEVKPYLTGAYQWSWTSPLPLQCTSHSVRLRFRDHLSHTSDWTPFYRLDGKDADENSENNVYPKDHVVRVGEGIVFCCILKQYNVAESTSPAFKIQISNRTFATEPIYSSVASPGDGFDVSCGGTGSTYFVGYAPDDQNLTCETRDLSSVECHWSRGKIGDAYMIKNVTYTVNGRHCSFDSCVLDESVYEGVMNWTLIAKNVLGIKIISDLADPKHRVRLRAPVEPQAILVQAGNATLEWAWKETKYDSFLMICQAEVNGHTLMTTFSGLGLKSLVLADLQPFTYYTARVRCGSREHFYKWGDWSVHVTFSTKEDIPEAMDVWMHVFNGQTYIVWKNLNTNQSHGTITGYDLLLGRSLDKNIERITKASNESCHKLRSVEKYNFISISAKNSAGISSPSNITIPNLWSDSVEITNVSNVNDGGLSVTWKPSRNSICGYVVEWFPTFRMQECAVKWMKIQPGTTNATVYSDFEEGVKYNLSIYACTSEAPELLQRSQVYVKELHPSGKVLNLRADQIGSDIKLSWEEMREEDKRGVILGYIVSYKLSVGDLPREQTIKDPRLRQHTLKLDAGDYTFQVKAFTSAGEGPGSEITAKIDYITNGQIYNLIFIILTILATVAFIIIITVFCCIKRKWLKSKLYPDIPKPMLSESLCIKGFHQCHVIDKMLLSEIEVLMADNPEPCFHIVPQVQKECEEVSLMPKDPLWPKYYNDVYDSQTVPPIALDPFYMEVPSPGIQNPTYSVHLPAGAHLVLGYVPQTQNCNNQSQACDVTSVPVGSEGYQPQ